MTDTGGKHSGSTNSPILGDKGGAIGHPGLADSLRKIYDSVLDEPLPDALKDLLSKLDDQAE